MSIIDRLDKGVPEKIGDTAILLWDARSEIERLRERNHVLEAAHRQDGATIKRLTAENERLRAALIEIGLTRDAQKARLIASRAFGDNQQTLTQEQK